jgi:hypothetical protein
MIFTIDFPAFLASLAVLAKGMFGIFIVTGAIVLAMMLLGKLTGRNNK